MKSEEPSSTEFLPFCIKLDILAVTNEIKNNFSKGTRNNIIENEEIFIFYMFYTFKSIEETTTAVTTSIIV